MEKSVRESDIIRPVDLTKTNQTSFKRGFADCVILTHDHKILLQQRPLNWKKSPGCLTTFGGGIEAGETPMAALIRELKEELGADVVASDIHDLGAITEAFTNYTEIVHGYFWHDARGTITGCYECEPACYATVADAFAHPKIMDYVRWFLHECQKRSLL